MLALIARGEVDMRAVSPTLALFPGWRGMLEYEDRATQVGRHLVANHPRLTDAIVLAPFADFEQIQARQPSMRGYTFVSPEMRTFMGRVPGELSGPYLAMLLLWQIARFEAAFARTKHHQEFRLQAIDSIHRILDQIEAGTDWADIHDDAFMKDLGIVRLSILAAVAQLIYPYAGMMRRPVIKAGLGALLYVYGRCGGAAPFLEIHTHKTMMAQYFNPKGWDETYRLIALALQSFPRARGMMGVSWFYDPQLDKVSPRLKYLREVPLAGGARLVPIGAGLDSVALATATSATRRDLHAQGKYTPISNALVWSRRDILKTYG